MIRYRNAATILSLGIVSLSTAACGGDDTRQLEPGAVAMNDKTTAFYDDGELTLYEVQAEVKLPLKRPTDAQKKDLGKAITPFDRAPFIKRGDVRVQLTWTLANLDKDTHNVEVLIDPWNEFGRYVPGITMDGEDAIPNFSGIQELYELPGTGDPRGSRITHSFTYDDMDELATDFATVMNIIKTVQPVMNGDQMDDPRPGYVNHTFAVENRSGKDPLTDQYRPAVIPGLLGFDLGLRTREQVNVALEYTIELVDKSERLLAEDSHDPPLEAPHTTITLGE